MSDKEQANIDKAVNKALKAERARVSGLIKAASAEAKTKDDAGNLPKASAVVKTLAEAFKAA